MTKANKSYIILLLLFCCAFTKLNAQQNLSADSKLKLDAHQDSLLILSDAAFEAKDDLLRFEKNALFVKKLVTALKTNGSFNYGFDSLKNITVLSSPDRSFRIITWFIATNEGAYHFYGTIQMATNDGSLKLHPLTDHTNMITDENAITTNKDWFGARYYEMIPVMVNGKQPYFILLGWKGNNQKTTKKVIEVLSFDKGEPSFGKSIFEVAKNIPVKNRIVFAYNKMNAMTLTFDKKVNMIVFDHLVPYDPKMVGNFEFYATDSSFDGYKLTYGKLSLTENVVLKNDASENDEFYRPPVKASTLNKKGN